MLRAATVAAFNAWTLAIFAAVTLLGVVLGDMTSLVVAAALGIFAHVEFRGAALFRRFDPSAARLVGYNQLALGAAIVAYAAWQLYQSQHSSALAEASQTGDPATDAMLSNLTSTITIGLYGTVAAVGIIAPGLNAWYYFSRDKVVRRMVDRTPVWVIDALRAAA
ncbi:MAG: hypothetical protein AABZ53_15330 [Planctomycetota bacterium]